MMEKSNDRGSVYTVQTVNNALELLEALAESPGSMTLGQLTKRIGLNRNKTFRLLTTLCEKGVAERDVKTGTYRLGIYSMALAQKFLVHASVINYAHPILADLVRKHGEAVYMTVLKDDEVLFLDMVDCAQSVKAASMVGRRFPFFTNAAGKVMKALDSRELLEKLFKKRGRGDGMPNLDRFESELREIRSRGVAIDSGGLGEGIICVAVAVRDYAGKVVGAITMLGPSFRMIADRLEKEIIPSMLEGGEVLSAKFGYARG